MTYEQRRWAVNRIRARRGFWSHFVVYLAVNALLVAIWAMSSPGYFWPAWPMLGWGIGLAGHAVVVIIGPKQISEERINREIERVYGLRDVPHARP